MAERRRRKLVERFQYKLIARIIIYWSIYQVTLWNFLFCGQLLHEGRGNLLEQYGRFCRESYPMLICFLILVPAFAWDAVKFYHRIAGPVYRFRRTLREIAAEQPVRHIRLRAGDELTEMQNDFNAMLDTLQRRGAVTLTGGSAARDAGGSAMGVAVFSADPRVEDASHAAG